LSEPIKWNGANRVLLAPKDTTKEQVQDLHVFTNGIVCVSKWKLSEEALTEIIKTGYIFLSVYSGHTQPPVFLGSEAECHAVAVDYGPVWKLNNA